MWKKTRGKLLERRVQKKKVGRLEMFVTKVAEGEAEVNGADICYTTSAIRRGSLQ